MRIARPFTLLNFNKVQFKQINIRSFVLYIRYFYIMEESKTQTRKRKAENETGKTEPKKRAIKKTQEASETSVKIKKTAEKKEPRKRVKKETVTDISEEVEGVSSAKAVKPKRTAVKKPTSKNTKDEDEFDGDLQEVSGDLPNVWDEVEMLSQFEKVPQNVAQKFISLLTEGCTLPFIARYRKDAVDHLAPDRLQEMYESYQNVIQFKKKVQSVLQALKKSKKLTPELEKSILNAKSLSELDFIYAPLKSHSQTLAEKARNLGLEPCAIRALNGDFVDIQMLCDLRNEELATFEKVESHITHIVADIIYKDERVLQHMRELKTATRFILQSSQTKSSTKEKKEDENKKIDTKSNPETYKIYFDWTCPVNFVKSHQTLAVNRGENEKILSVKVLVPDWFYNRLERFCLSQWKSAYWVKKGLGDAYNRLIKPWLSRQVRSELTVVAQKEAIKTFTNNLEKYLLTEPVKNRRIAGLDPGFRAGCKVGIIDCNGEKLDAFTIYPDLQRFHQNDLAAKQLQLNIKKHGVELIGLGNGTACRETEQWLKKHHISDEIHVIIVPEQGASIYSISKEAQKEHPNMDPNLISALSIARRVLDPLGELIKVDPKNLGVGLYQHDIPPKMLESALDNAVEKVVSLVGVDINTASQAMLRRISGLNDGRAKKIIAYRQENECFSSRAEILKVPGIGKVTYQQCAGFLKVLGGTEPLDTTIIHPESYKIAKLFAKKIGVNIRDLTKPTFSEQMERCSVSIDPAEMSKELGTDVSTLELIISAFKQKPYEDNVITFCRPVYSMAVHTSEEISIGTTLTGVVRNVVPFGCFVDCGVGDNGLIHRSKLNGHMTPKLGDRVAVTVIASPKPKKLQLQLDKILT